MLERTIRIWEADSSQPREMAGMITPGHPRRSMPPALGSHPRYTVKSRMSNNPTQKTGIDWQAKTSTVPEVLPSVNASLKPVRDFCETI